MRHVNEANDCLKFKFEGLAYLEDIMRKDDHMVAFDLNKYVFSSHLEFHPSA